MPTTYKYVFIGDNHCGKTSLVRALLNTPFRETYHPTQCFEAQYQSYNEEITVELQDISNIGAAYFKPTCFYPEASVVFVLFDLNNPISFKHVDKWFADINKGNPSVYRILVGTKTDLAMWPYDIKKEAIFKKAEEHDCLAYAEISAKTGEGIDRLFKTVTSFIDTIQRCPPSYETFWKKQQGSDWQKTCAFLEDYAKGNSTFQLHLHGHFRRHHTKKVFEIVKKIKANQYYHFFDDLIPALSALVDEPKGSLARRIAFIQAKTKHLVIKAPSKKPAMILPSIA